MLLLILFWSATASLQPINCVQFSGTTSRRSLGAKGFSNHLRAAKLDQGQSLGGTPVGLAFQPDVGRQAGKPDLRAYFSALVS